MRIVPIAILALLLAAADAKAQAAPSVGDAAVRQELAQAIRARLDAYGRGDADTWSRFVADDCLLPVWTKAGIRQDIAARPAAFENGYGEIADLTAHVYGEVAVTRYRITEYTAMGSQKIGFEEWRIETYARRDGRWLLVAGSDRVIPRDPAVAKVDPALCAAYAGRYEYAPGIVDTATCEAGHLMVQATGQEKEEVFPESETTYFGQGQDWRLVFVRDGAGKVTELRFRQHGQDLVAKRLP